MPKSSKTYDSAPTCEASERLRVRAMSLIERATLIESELAEVERNKTALLHDIRQYVEDHRTFATALYTASTSH